MLTQDLNSVNRAFSKQSGHFDADDRRNLILQDLRNEVYGHVNKFLNPQSRILELNAGTGIDAKHFIEQGHSVHATDLSDGMIAQLNYRKLHSLPTLTVQQLSFEQVDQVASNNYDLVFSNFGGLNCTRRLDPVAHAAAAKLKVGGHLIWVIMPDLCLWEMMGVFKCNRSAFRRLSRNGVMSNLEGEKFVTWYHSLSAIKKAMPPSMKFVSSVGLAAISPPPHRDDIPIKRPALYKTLRNIDRSLHTLFPFNRYADHIVVTFKKQ